MTSLTRFALRPNGPTPGESGLPGCQSQFLERRSRRRKKTPKAIVDRLNIEVHGLASSPQIRQRFGELGFEQNLSTRDGMKQLSVDKTAK